ncbi:MAG: extracellular solute-binding protein [Chloroflexi bacterium]|nr:MAG: extracellular solute-binding protein [Chloroflexota bacterium]
MVDFSQPGGPSMYEQALFDLRPGIGSSATETDADGDITTIQWRIPNPNFAARPSENEVHGYEWRLGASVTLTIDDPDNGVGIDYTDVETVLAAGWPPTQTFVQFRLWDDGFVLEPGQLVTLSDGVTTRDHTVTALTVTSVDAALDTVSGKAHPGSFVDVGHVCDSNGCSYRHVLADANGDWIADFAHPGDESNEQQLFDLIPGSRSSVHQSDESGDNTTVDWHVPNPYIEASPRNNWVRVRDWPRGAVVTLTIDRAGSSYTTTATMQPVPWDPNNPNNLMADFNLPEYDIRAGDQLTATVGSESKTLIVSSLEVTGFDVNIDTLSGVATPGAQLSVCANLPGTCIQRSVVADASTGAWSANFSGEVDLQPGSTGWARERDSGGNETWYDWHVPNPYIEASALYNWVHARDWPLGTEVALTIDGANGIYTTTAMMEYPSWDNNNPDRIQADFKLNGYDIQAGDRITATVGTESKTLIVSSLKVTSFDLENDTLAGVADAGTPVEICANVPGNCVHRWATPDASGAWTTDFGNEVDLQSGSDGWSLQTDENGDQTWYDWHVPDPHFLVYSFGSTVHGFEWPLGASVTLTVDDPDNGLGVDYSDEQTVFLPDWNPDQTLVAFTVDGFTLQPGQLVTLSDGVTTKTHTVTTLAITAIDAELDTVSGTAEPGSLIKVDFWGTRRVTADANGEWVADFAHVGEDPDEQDLADIFPGASISVHQPDDDGNSTSIDWRLPDPRFSARLSDNEVHGYDFAVGSFVTLTIDDPDNGAGVDYTDTQTVEVADWNPDETFVPFRLWEDGFVLEPGQLLSVTDGSVTRMLTVSPLRVTAVDADADTVSGTTTPGSQVEVGHLTCDENGCYGYRRVTADEDGVWVADFAHVGEDGGEQDIIDVVIGIGSQANVCDENGNCTEIGWHVFAYTLHAVPSYPEVHGHDWPEDADVTLTIDNDIDPGNGVLYTRTKNVDDDPWCGAPCFDLSNVFDLEVGQYVTMADAHVSRTVQVSVLMVTEVDAEHEILRGIADPGSLVTVNIWSQDGLARHVTTQPDGTWVADFSVSGDEDDEQRTTDIRFGDNGRAIQLNADGTDDGTLEYWTALRPRPDYIKANPSDDWVHSRGWTADAQLTLTVDDPNTPQPVDYTYPGTVSMQQAPWDPGDSDDILAIFDLSGAFDLQVGNTVTVSDGITTHDYVVTPLVQVRWFVGLGTGADPVQIAVQQQVVDDFNIAHPNIELIFEVRPAETALTTLRAQIASGNAPDIIGPMGLYTSDQLRGQWLDLSALVQATGYDTSQFNPALLEMYQTEEGLVGLPFAVYPAVLYYQKSLFDAANLNYPPANYGDPYIWRHNGTQVEWNFETLTQVARQLTNVSNRQYGFIPQWQSPNAIGSFWGPDKLFAGSPSNYTATIPTQWSAAWQWYYDGMWGNEPFIPTSHIANNNWGGNAFDSGQVAMAITEAWYTCCIGGAGSNWDLAALPSYNGSVHGLIHADTFQILKKSAHASEAFEAVTYLLDDAAPVLTTAYNAMPAHTADQDAYFARKSAQFPWVTNWEIMQAGLDYPDIPGNEAWVPNLEQALNRVQAFGDLLSNQDNLNFNQAQNNLQNDLAVIFNAGEPNIEASAQDNWVHARDWPLGTAVTLTIEGAGGPYTTTAAMQQASGNPTDPNDIVAAFDLQGYDIRPGDSLTVNAGTESKTLIVSALTVSGFNLASNTLSGRAAPGAQVEVCAQTSNDCVYRLVTGNNLVGIWNANFGNRFDLKPGSRGWALERDVDGDATYFNWNTALARSDFDGDGDTDLSVFRPTLAKWFVKDQTNGAFGMSGDIPVPADYDGDGDADWAVFRPTMGKWFVKDQSNGYFGMPGDVPVPADYDGDGDADWAVFRPTTGKWFVKDQGNGYFGMPGDIPVPADYDGDGDSDWAVWRPATGKWYIKDQGNGSFGMEGDIPLPADYDGDGDADWAVWRPATGKWYIKDIWSGVYGTSTDIPVPGDYDGDGDVDVAFFRPSTGRWYVKDQAGATFGMNGDFPTPARDTNADGDPYE